MNAMFMTAMNRPIHGAAVDKVPMTVTGASLGKSYSASDLASR